MSKLNLPQSGLGVARAVETDQKTLFLWQQNSVFERTNEQFQSSNPEPYVFLDGPPYANGSAHLGHALNKLLKDLVLKSRWAQEQSVVYTPGWDCHGLPLELVVEKKYGKLSAVELEKRCKLLALQSVAKQKKDFKRLGVMADWEHPYLTLSDFMRQKNWETLASLYDQNLLEYKRYPTHYCPQCQSSLAQAELENKVLDKHSLYFVMTAQSALLGEMGAVVWTTTPWTLPMNQALAYHPEFNYEVWGNALGQKLVLQNPELLPPELLEGYTWQHTYAGKEFGFSNALSPLTQMSVPVLEASFVEAGATGFVHMAPAHGPEDYELCEQHLKTEVSTYLSRAGHFENLSPSLATLEGKYFAASGTAQEVVHLLHLQGQPVSHTVERKEQHVCWRHKCEVYYNALPQVFLLLNAPHNNLKDKVQGLLEHTELSAENKEKLLHMTSTRPHWCLSRQRVWGCPLELLVNTQTQTLSEHTPFYLRLLAAGQKTQAQQFLTTHPELTAVKDVLDVWFDSGNAANALYKKTGKMPDMVLEGKDQFRGWFQSLVWLRAATSHENAFSNLLSHGFVLNESKEKLAKSSGNASALSVYLQKYGADVLRFWVAGSEVGPDVVFSETKLKEMQKFYARLRLTLRFLSSNLYDYQTSPPKLEDKELQDTHFHLGSSLGEHTLSQLEDAHKFLQNCYAHYDFKGALTKLYEFCDKELSAQYFEYAKNVLYLEPTSSPLRQATQAVLFQLWKTLTHHAKVLAPFLAEEVYQDMRENCAAFKTVENPGSVFLYPTQFTATACAVKEDWSALYTVRQKVLASLEPLQQTKTLRSKQEAKVSFKGLLVNAEVFSCPQFSQYFLGVSQFEYARNGEAAPVLEVVDLKASTFKCMRCWFYHTTLNEEKVCSGCERQLFSSLWKM